MCNKGGRKMDMCKECVWKKVCSIRIHISLYWLLRFLNGRVLLLCWWNIKKNLVPLSAWGSSNSVFLRSPKLFVDYHGKCVCLIFNHNFMSLLSVKIYSIKAAKVYVFKRQWERRIPGDNGSFETWLLMRSFTHISMLLLGNIYVRSYY